MRQAFAHDAVVTMDPGGDEGALGAAITVALCGHWEHEPPCPLAPHHTRAKRSGGGLELRTLFVVEPDLENAVRERIDGALASSRLDGPGDVATTWALIRSRRGEVEEAELEHAERLIEGT